MYSDITYHISVNEDNTKAEIAGDANPTGSWLVDKRAEGEYDVYPANVSGAWNDDSTSCKTFEQAIAYAVERMLHNVFTGAEHG